MNYTNCCNAPFGNPGWPDCDLCSDCHEHAEPIEENMEEIEENNPKRRIEIEITYEGLHCEEKKSNDNPFGLQDL